MAVIERVDPPPVERLVLADTPPYKIRGGGGARWRVLDHPRDTSSIEYDGTSPHTTVIRVHLDARRSMRSDIEADIALLESWTRRTSNGEPPSLALRWGQGQQMRWVIDGELRWTDMPGDGRDPSHGRRALAIIDIPLLEDRRSTVVFETLEDEVTAQADPGTDLTYYSRRPSASRTYTVRAGDTLTIIAARELGDASRMEEIYQANITLLGSRGRDYLQVGWVLTLP